jgi:dUTP pyrophosphatase
MVALHNHSQAAATIEPGERIAQLVITPYIQGIFNEVDVLDDTERGTGGFGSTGTH